jgi:hypothetical protein
LKNYQFEKKNHQFEKKNHGFRLLIWIKIFIKGRN